ncbi:MAG: hypothetical protein ACXVJW_03995 [Acidimicrobiia bacterium]
MSAAQTKAPRGRSPSFPGLSLKVAVQRAQTAYEQLRTHPSPLGTFTAVWGYKSPTTGPATVALAALRKYGLLKYEGEKGGRTARLTDLAVEILVKPDNKAAIQKAALLPPIHKEMWDRFGSDLPPESALRYEFEAQRGFTDSGFRDFLKEYRETVAFAELASSASVGEQADLDEGADDGTEELDDENDDNQQKKPRRQRRTGAGMLTYAVPVAAGHDVTVEGRFPLSETEWAQFMAVLQAMRPALVGDGVAEEPDDS